MGPRASVAFAETLSESAGLAVHQRQASGTYGYVGKCVRRLGCVCPEVLWVCAACHRYVLIAAVLHVFVALKRTWDITSSYSLTSGKWNLAITGIVLLSSAGLRSAQMTRRFRVHRLEAWCGRLGAVCALLEPAGT